MEVRNDPERFDERLDEFAETPLRPVPIVEHANDDQSNDDGRPTAPSDQVVFDQKTPPPPAPAPASAAPAVSLLGSDPADVRDRWRDLQSCFVDDPRDAVQRADSLMEEMTASIHQSLESRIRELQDLWKNTSQHDTEQLRLALRSYRDVMHRLLPLADEQTTH
ncbi:hypothetical protein SAMN05444920_13832 [Nonomuraea solani]|uniref:Uncharacterized protein n=1 Tax=Nonomuraea solani TaxID=1144553 RepID=A0A1H6F2T2_9ACTN|nr:hypothetical protein [Nonomuraea solani]SEH03529.1 hypothetical protein SAMN05444920_13832 [Nonomuraea solani]